MASRKAGIGAKMEQAAIELYDERRSLKMTGAEIAARAGTTERTFYRHFPDKLDAFFGDETRLRAQVADAVEASPPGVSPLTAALSGLAGLATLFDANRGTIHRRAAIVAAHPELRARETARTTPWITVLREALRRRGAPPGDIDLVAPLALILWRVAYERWVEDPDRLPLQQRLGEVIDEAAVGLDLAGPELRRPATSAPDGMGSSGSPSR